jgi:hypothetical protein
MIRCLSFCRSLSFGLFLDLLLYLLESISIEKPDESLYDGAPVIARNYHQQVFEFGNSLRLDDQNMNRLLKLIGDVLPIEHKLVKSCKKLVSFFQVTSSYDESLRCVACLKIIDDKNICSIFCDRNQEQRRVGDIIEHVTMNRSNQQLINIIRRNQHLIVHYPQAVDQLLSCDVMTGSVYTGKRNSTLTATVDTYPVTLMLHIDGAPLVRWAKKQTWLVMGSIVEIPPPLRENQANMLLLSFW